ncbi:MAG: hypothetical protein ACI9VS_002747 [Candidatus Binatia bacterium]|jgi:hypothetical protein
MVGNAGNNHGRHGTHGKNAAAIETEAHLPSAKMKRGSPVPLPCIPCLPWLFSSDQIFLRPFLPETSPTRQRKILNKTESISEPSRNTA